MPDSRKNKSLPSDQTREQDMPGISFDEDSKNVPVKPGKEVYEVVNKHLSPSAHKVGDEHVFNVTQAFDDSTVAMGTIVSDKKRRHTPIAKSLKSAFNEWWGNARKSFDDSSEIIESKNEKQGEVEKLDIEDHSRTPKKVTKNTIRPSKNKHNVIIEKIKTFQKDAKRAKGIPYIIKTTSKNKILKKKQKVKLPVLSNTKTKTILESIRIETPDLRKDMVAPVVKKRIQKNINTYEGPKITKEIISSKRSETKKAGKKASRVKLPPIKPNDKKSKVTSNIFVPSKITVRSSHKFNDENEPTIVPQKKLEWNDELVSQKFETATHALLEKSPIPQKQSNLPRQTPITSVSAHTTHEIDFKERDLKIPTRPTDFTRVSNETKPNKWRLVLRIFIGVAIIGIGISLIVYSVSKFNIFEKNTTQLTEPVYIPAFFEVDTQTSISMTGDKKQFLSTLRGLVDSANTEVTQFYPVRENETVLQNIPTREMLELLNTKLDRKSVGVLEDISMLGSVMTDYNEPYIIMRSYNFDTLFSGFLKWEMYMYDDLYPLFGKNALSSTTFVDAVKNNIPTRILYNENGVEIILYAFINRNIVIITTSTSALSKILERL